MDDVRKKLMLDWLRGIGVVEINVHFDGSGDDGQIVEVQCVGITNKLLEAPAPGYLFEKFNIPFNPVAEDQLTVQDLVEALCYEFLTFDVLGFDYINNDGGSGVITIKPSDNSIEMIGYENISSQREHNYKMSIGQDEHTVGDIQERF